MSTLDFPTLNYCVAKLPDEKKNQTHKQTLLCYEARTKSCCITLKVSRGPGNETRAKKKFAIKSCARVWTRRKTRRSRWNIDCWNIIHSLFPRHVLISHDLKSFSYVNLMGAYSRHAKAFTPIFSRLKCGRFIYCAKCHWLAVEKKRNCEYIARPMRKCNSFDKCSKMEIGYKYQR